MTDLPVLPCVEALTEQDARHLLAAGMLATVHENGPTRVGLKIGADESTVRKARDKRTTLRLDTAWNLLLADAHALDPLAAHFGKKLVDADTVCERIGATAPMAKLLSKIADAESPDSAGGVAITDGEIADMIDEVRLVRGICEMLERRYVTRRVKAVA